MDKRFVWREVGKIIAGYPFLECDRCALAVSKWLTDNEISYKIIRLRTKRRSEFFIVSQRCGMNDSITENGTHYGVEVFGLVFDNLSDYGLSRDEWIADFSCRSGRFIIDEVESLGG
jgi:hypothetical protein